MEFNLKYKFGHYYKVVDFKTEIGGLGSKLQQELDYVNAAISLFETTSDQATEKSDN